MSENKTEQDIKDFLTRYINQDNLMTSMPIFHVIKEIRKDFIPSRYGDEVMIMDTSDGCKWYKPKEFFKEKVEKIKEEYGNENNNYGGDFTAENFEEFLYDKIGDEVLGYEVVRVTYIDEVKTEDIFLLRSEAENCIKDHRNHYFGEKNVVHTCGSAWSPETRKFFNDLFKYFGIEKE